MNTIFSKIFLISGMLLLFSTALSAQAVDCDDEAFLDDCAGQIAGYKFLKANKVSITGGKSGQAVELSSVFSNGSTYTLTACGGGQSMIVTLYDRNRKLIMTNFNKQNRKFYPSINYKCTATGVYYFKYEFESGGAGCGVGIIGFKQN
jgi:hypothetical protein